MGGGKYLEDPLPLWMIYVHLDTCGRQGAVYIAGEDEETELEMLDDVEWAGPIPLPKEAGCTADGEKLPSR